MGQVPQRSGNCRRTARLEALPSGRWLRLLAVALAGALLGGVRPLAGATHYVDALAGNDAFDGQAAVTAAGHGPKATLRAALAGAGPGDTVVVHPGVYLETIHLQAADLTLTSLDPADPDTVAATIISGDPSAVAARTGVIFGGGAGPGTLFAGFTISVGVGRGIECNGGATPTIDRCVVRGNRGDAEHPGGAILCVDSAPTLRRTLIWGNSSPQGCGGIELLRSSPLLLNCTIAANEGGDATQPAGAGVLCQDSSPSLRNCILWGNRVVPWPSAPQILCRDLSTPRIAYSCIQGGRAGTPDAAWGPGNLEADPCFADPGTGDYRLRSTGGRWDGSRWVADDLTSPGVDAGAPADEYAAEPLPNGDRVNLGFDGGTALASRSPPVLPALVLEPAVLTVPEGGTAYVTVSLTRAPAGPLVVSLRLEPPDAGVSLVPGAPLTLDPATWVAGVTASLMAPEDDADSRDAHAVLWVEGAGLLPVPLGITVVDDDVTLSVAGGTPAGTTVHERGTAVEISAQPQEQQHFVRWSGDTAGIADPLAASTNIRLDAPAAVTAQSAVDRYALVIRSDYGTPQGAGEYAAGQTAVWSVSSPVTVAVGERRVAAAAGAPVVMDMDRLVTVDWHTEYLLTTAAVGPGHVDTASVWLPAAASVRLAAIPGPNGHLRGWVGDLPAEGALDNPLALVMDRPRTLTAVFARNPISNWAAVTVNQPCRPGADYGWVEVSRDASGGWQSDLSMVVPPAVPSLLLAYYRAWPQAAPGHGVGGDFERDSPDRLPRDWLRCPQWPTERCLVTSTPPFFPGLTRSLRLQGSTAGPQGLFAPCSALNADSVVQCALYLPSSLPPEAALLEFWHNGTGIALRTTAAGLPTLELGNAGALRPAYLNQPLTRGAWNVITFFQWFRSDTDGDGMDDAWEKQSLPGDCQTAAGDADGDGLSNLAEYGLGTAPADPDSDRDGMADGWEVGARLDPLADDAGADPDGDLLPNLLEARLGTAPHLADAPTALLAAVSGLAFFWPLAQSCRNPLDAALDLAATGPATFAAGTLVLAGGGATLAGVPAAQATAPARTLTLWFQSAGGGPLLATASAAAGVPAATLRLDAGGRLSATVAGLGPDADATVWTLAADTVPDAWHQVVLCCPDADAPVLYLDGALVRAPAASRPTVLAELASWDRLCVGADSAAAAPPEPAFHGQLCGLAWFTTALSADAVRQLYRAGRGLALDTLLTLDLDADGLPDTWEYACFGDLAAGPQDDPDQDGLPNASECRLGCNPAVPDSDGDGLTDGAEVQTYGTDPTRPDTDGDGLSDGLEVNQLGSDPRRADTDGDGLPDGWEIAHGLSPLNADSDGDGTADAASDSDEDGFTNAAEMANGTDPGAPDVADSSVSFTTLATTVREANAVLRVGVALSALPPGRSSVTLVVAQVGGSARRGADFEFADTPVTFSAGHLTGQVEVRLLADLVPEPEETIILALQKVCGARRGTPAIHTIRILDAVSPADDTDADGLPDAWEMRWFGNLSARADEDPDHDGLSNLEEYRCGARPDQPCRAANPAELGLRLTGLGR